MSQNRNVLTVKKKGKIGTLVCILVLLFMSNPVFAQKNPLDTEISGSYSTVSLRDILADIEKNTGIQFSYSARKIDVDKTITLSFQNSSVYQVLEELSYQVPISFELVDGYIVLKKGLLKTASGHESPGYDRFTVNGYIQDTLTGEFLIGATLFVKELELGTISNKYGFFSLTVPKGTYSILLSYIGYTDIELPLELFSNIKLDFSLKPVLQELEEVTVTSVRKEEQIFQLHASQSAIQPAEVAKTPSILGESDVIKTLEFQPGISFYGDGSSYFNVRGGHYDQNLILLDEATIYNPSHLLGIFSPIIPDAVKTVDIYKADFPVNYGGRLSSVVDIHTRDGNKSRFAFSGYTGIISLRGTVEGPIKHDASSFFVSFRRSYFDVWLKPANDDLEGLYFYDFTTKFNIRMGSKNRLFLTLYKGEDVFRTKGRSGLGGLNWGNNSATLRWNHIFGSRVFLNSTIYSSRYDYYLHTNLERGIYWNSRIQNSALKEEITFYATPGMLWKYGFKAGFYDFNPGNYYHPDRPISNRVSPVKSFELILYGGGDHEVLPWLRVRYGLRIVSWSNYGEAFVYQYDEQYQPLVRTDYAEGEKFFEHGALEPRLSLAVRTGKLTGIKASYNRTSQNVNLITNSISPFNSLEVWLPAGPNIRPQYADIIDLGFVKETRYTGLTLQTDIFYKWMYNQIGYEYHASMLVNPLIEGELRQGDGWAYGFEMSLKKQGEKLNGTIAYTFSRSFLKIEGLNENKTFPAIQDRPHVLNITCNYQIRTRWMLGVNYSLASGSRFTSPTSFYDYRGYQVPVYASLNNDRLSVYRRLDLSSSWQLNRQKGRFNHSFTFSIYNMTGRENPVFINFNKTLDEEGNLVVPADRLNESELTASMRYTFKLLPSVSYQFNF